MERNRNKSPLLRRVRHRLTVHVSRLLLWLVPKLSLEFSQRSGRLLGRIALMLPVAGERRRRTEDHIALAWPEKDTAFHRSLLRGSYETMGMVLLETLWGPNWNAKADLRRVTVENGELYHRVLAETRAEGRGLLVIGAHLGCWELLAGWFAASLDRPLLVVGAEPSLPEVGEMLKRQRERQGTTVAWRGEAGVPVFRQLKRGDAVVIIGDHNIKGEGIEVPFFGQPAHTLVSPARLALKANARVLCVFPFRHGDGRMRVSIMDPEEGFDRAAGTMDERIAELTRRYTAVIESAIRQDPGQWLWMHRRWRKRTAQENQESDS